MWHRRRNRFSRSVPSGTLTNGGELPSGRKTRSAHGNKLLRNLGDLRFADVTARTGLTGSQNDFGAAAADYDGDGHVDLLVSELREVALYRNDGNGHFEDVTAASGIDNKGRWSGCCGFVRHG